MSEFQNKSWWERFSDWTNRRNYNEGFGHPNELLEDPFMIVMFLICLAIGPLILFIHNLRGGHILPTKEDKKKFLKKMSPELIATITESDNEDTDSDDSSEEISDFSDSDSEPSNSKKLNSL